MTPPHIASPPRLATVLMVILLSVGVGESLLYSSQNDVPNGVFSVSFAGMNVRLVDILVLTAGLSSFFSPRKFPLPRGLLLACAAMLSVIVASWIFVAETRSPIGTVLTEARWVLYLLVLLPLTRILDIDDLSRIAMVSLRLLAIPVGVSVLLDIGSVVIPVPGMPGAEFGVIGGDTATMLGVLSVLAVVKHSPLWLLFVLPAALTNQRAAILATLVWGGLGAVVVLSIRRRGRRSKRPIRPLLVSVALIVAPSAILLS